MKPNNIKTPTSNINRIATARMENLAVPSLSSFILKKWVIKETRDKRVPNNSIPKGISRYPIKKQKNVMKKLMREIENVYIATLSGSLNFLI